MQIVKMVQNVFKVIRENISSGWCHWRK